MRVVAGELRGRRLVAPPGRATRPTADRVREALFSLLGDVSGLRVLDLFAGSGALAVEALSRGAAEATLVERSPRALGAIRANLAMVPRADRRTRVVGRDWRAALRAERAAGRSYDLCLIDPPYSLLPRIAAPLGRALAPLAAPGARVVVEHAAGTTDIIALPDLAISSRIDHLYGDTALSVFVV